MILKNKTIDIIKIQREIISYTKYKKIKDLKIYIYKKKPAKISIIITLYNQIKEIKLIKGNFLQEIKQFYFQKENIFL